MRVIFKDHSWDACASEDRFGSWLPRPTGGRSSRNNDGTFPAWQKTMLRCEIFARLRGAMGQGRRFWLAAPWPDLSASLRLRPICVSQRSAASCQRGPWRAAANECRPGAQRSISGSGVGDARRTGRRTDCGYVAWQSNILARDHKTHW